MRLLNSAERRDQIMRIAAIGAGDFGALHLEVYNELPQVDIAWICERHPERIAHYAEKYQCRITANIDDVLNDPTVDAVSILTPEHAHFEQAMAALQHGKHVLIEKPVSTEAAQVEVIAKQADEKGLIAMPGHTCRFIGSFARARAYIEDQQITPVSIFARRNIPRERLPLHNRTHPVLMALSHDIDLILSYVKSKPRRILGMERKTDPSLQNPDIFWGMIQFEDGCIVALETLWVLPTSGKYVESAMEIAGIDQVLHINYPSDGIWINTSHGLEFPDPAFFEKVNGEWTGALKSELSYFVRCVEERRKPEVVTMKEAATGLRIAQLLIQSAAEGREMTF